MNLKSPLVYTLWAQSGTDPTTVVALVVVGSHTPLYWVAHAELLDKADKEPLH